MTPATFVLVLQISAIISGFTSAVFWFRSTQTQYKSIGHKGFIGSPNAAIVTSDALTLYFSEIGKKNMVAAGTSGLTALFFAGIILMQTIYGIDALG